MVVISTIGSIATFVVPGQNNDLPGDGVMRFVLIAIVRYPITGAAPLRGAEPVVDGKPLSRWVQQLHEGKIDKCIEAAATIYRYKPDSRH